MAHEFPAPLHDAAGGAGGPDEPIEHWGYVPAHVYSTPENVNVTWPHSSAPVALMLKACLLHWSVTTEPATGAEPVEEMPRIVPTTTTATTMAPPIKRRYSMEPCPETRRMPLIGNKGYIKLTVPCPQEKSEILR